MTTTLLYLINPKRKKELFQKRIILNIFSFMFPHLKKGTLILGLGINYHLAIYITAFIWISEQLMDLLFIIHISY